MLELLLPLFGKIFDRIIPDPIAAANSKLELMKLVQSGELAQLTSDTSIALAQLDVNKAEATNPSLLVSGGRPFIIWVCGVAFAIQYVVGPMASWIAALAGHPVQFPTLDFTVMMAPLMGLLGLGGYRTMEKIKGVAAI